MNLKKSKIPNKYKSHNDIIKTIVKNTKFTNFAAEIELIIQNNDWKYVCEYRHKWNHCERPRFNGEMRRKKAPIWQKESDPKPDWYLMTISDNKGNVAYIHAGHFNHDYDMLKLINCCSEILKSLIIVSESFLVIFKKECQLKAADRHMTLNFETGKVSWIK